MGATSKKIVYTVIACVIASAVFASCSQVKGYGLLLWSVNDPQIPSGTVLPVYIKSNIDNVWVVGVPGTKKKIELPLWKVELVGGKGKAKERAKKFAEYATVYAEAMTDGLPVREDPDNNAPRVYRLRQGQIVKVLEKAKGAPAMAGEAPLPGDWLKVLTDDGTTGFCFSYRLRLFDQADGAIAGTAAKKTDQADSQLDAMLAKTWRPENYKDMIDSRKVDLERFSVQYGFFPGQDSGVAKLVVPGVDVEQSYSGIKKVRDGVYRFEGASFQATLRSDTVLSVQYTDAGGAQRSLVFVALPVDAKDIVSQEQDRRDALYDALVKRGPSFRSENYGMLSFAPGGAFTWTGYEILTPTAIPAQAGSAGTAEMRLFLDPSLAGQYEGAVSLRFESMSPGKYVNFLYSLEPNGLKLEYLPSSSLDGSTVKRRSASPIVISFSRAER